MIRIEKTIDISAISGAFHREWIPFSNDAAWELQVIGEGITGTADGVIQLQQSSNAYDWNNQASGSSYTIAAAAFTHAFEKASYSSRYFGVKVTKENMTGGTLTLRWTIHKSDRK